MITRGKEVMMPGIKNESGFKAMFCTTVSFSRVEPKGKRNYESLLQFIYDFRVRTEMSVANLALQRVLLLLLQRMRMKGTRLSNKKAQ